MNGGDLEEQSDLLEAGSARFAAESSKNSRRNRLLLLALLCFAVVALFVKQSYSKAGGARVHKPLAPTTSYSPTPPPTDDYDDEAVFDVEEEEEEEANNILPPPAAAEPAPLQASSIDFLANLPCIPKICAVPRHFVPDNKQNKNFVLLASFPGSGNTWVRSIVEEGTRIWTGSVYLDKKLLVDGFAGEKIRPFDTPLSRVSAIKTHFPVYTRSSAFDYFKTSAAIQILRNPFDAMLAEFNRDYGTPGSHSSWASARDFKAVFPSWFEAKSKLWRTYMRYWVGTQHLLPNYVKSMDKRNGVTSIILERDLDVRNTTKLGAEQRRLVPILVLFYEDFILHFDETIARLFDFLKLQLGEAMPTSAKEAIVCALNKQHSNEKRPQSEDSYSPYTDVNSAKHLVKQFCNDTARLWFTEKWGDCLDTTPQVQRTNLIFDKSAKLPQEQCG